MMYSLSLAFKYAPFTSIPYNSKLNCSAMIITALSIAINLINLELVGSVLGNSWEYFRVVFNATGSFHSHEFLVNFLLRFLFRLLATRRYQI